MKRLAHALIVAAWFVAINQFVNDQPVGAFQAGPFATLEACQIQANRYGSGLMTNNDQRLSDVPGPCYNSKGDVKPPTPTP